MTLYPLYPQISTLTASYSQLNHTHTLLRFIWASARTNEVHSHVTQYARTN